MAQSDKPRKRASRVTVADASDAQALVAATVATAGESGALGWVRDDGDGLIRAHVEGEPSAVDEVVAVLRQRAGTAPTVERAKVEGHEQFAIRGVSAGRFVIAEHQASTHHYDLRLEVDGVMRSWAVPRGPSLDPAVKRLAVQVEDHGLDANVSERPPGPDGHGSIVWDQGAYEQGGRVRWPEALDRGHAVFVLHGAKLEGGFALQRTGRGTPPQWLLIKRRDDWARPGSDIVAERPESLLSGRTLADADADAEAEHDA
jgi:DNA ligase D-like protein (predicted 3'-phosphoesterase)